MSRRPRRTPLWVPAISFALLATGCHAGDEQALGIAILAYLFGMPLLLVQFLLLVIAAARQPRRPELTYVLSLFVGAGAIVLAGVGLEVLGEAPSFARPRVAEGAYVLLAAITTFVVWLSLAVVQLRRSTPRLRDDGDELLPPPSPAPMFWLSLAFPMLLALAAAGVCQW